ncbi:unnamed protein product [Closterium sp. NIES-54]
MLPKLSPGNLALLKAPRVSFDIASSQLNPIDGLHGTLRNVQGTLAVLTKSLLIPLSTNSDPRIGAGAAGPGGARTGGTGAAGAGGSTGVGAVGAGAVATGGATRAGASGGTGAGGAA